MKKYISKYNVNHTYWITTALINDYEITKEEFKKILDKNNIDIRPIFYPLSAMPPFENYVQKNMNEVNPVTYELSKYGVCLPNGNNLDDDDVEYVCHYFKKALGINS